MHNDQVQKRTGIYLMILLAEKTIVIIIYLTTNNRNI